eukprot:7356271-Prymnesium_polylepis.1
MAIDSEPGCVSVAKFVSGVLLLLRPVCRIPRMSWPLLGPRGKFNSALPANLAESTKDLLPGPHSRDFARGRSAATSWLSLIHISEPTRRS